MKYICDANFETLTGPWPDLGHHNCIRILLAIIKIFLLIVQVTNRKCEKYHEKLI